MALFGCAPKRPLDYLGSAGLLWAINGGRLLELHRDRCGGSVRRRSANGCAQNLIEQNAPTPTIFDNRVQVIHSTGADRS
jgi:hypothetical protein